MSAPKKNLTNLKIGETAMIEGFTDAELSVKLLEMGCLPGCEITLASKAPFGDPICISVCGYQLTLRLGEASTIEIK
jgi:ferrous iron transport protein A